MGAGAEGADLLLDESFYLIGEDEVFLGQNKLPWHIIYMNIYVVYKPNAELNTHKNINILM